MASQKDFVSDYQPGDRITVVLSGGTLIWSGVLAEIGERRIRLRMQDGTVHWQGANAMLPLALLLGGCFGGAAAALKGGR